MSATTPWVLTPSGSCQLSHPRVQQLICFPADAKMRLMAEIFICIGNLQESLSRQILVGIIHISSQIGRTRVPARGSRRPAPASRLPGALVRHLRPSRLPGTGNAQSRTGTSVKHITFVFSRNIGCFTRDVHGFQACSCSATIWKPYN